MRTKIKLALQAWRRWSLGSRHIALGAGCMLEDSISLRAGFSRGHHGAISVGKATHLARGVLLDAWGGSIHLGSHAYVGPYTVIYGQGGVSIGDATLISMHCSILSSNHRVPGLDRRILWEGDELLPTRIGADVWIGAGVTILGGVTIGDGCVIGAGSVVSKDLPAGSIAMGVPATVRGKRPETSR